MSLVNFDPAALTKTVNDFVARIEAMESAVETIVNKVEPIIAILAPFLPAPIGTALQELPELQIEIGKVKEFVNNTLVQVETLLGIPGIGEAARTGTVIPASELQLKATEAVHIAASDVGNYSGDTTEQAPPGMRFIMLNGVRVLEQIPPTE